MLAGMGGERFVAVFPGASIPERRWGVDRFRQVAGMLSGEGIPVVVVGGAEDRDAGEVIVRGVRGINLAGRTTLAETAALISRAALLVSGDSGILHIGVGLGIPTVSLFGPGIAAKWAPRGGRHKVVSRGLACSPCTRFGSTPECPYAVRCMDGITADEVFSAAMILMRHKEACQLNKVLDNPCADC
jgi:ADP-heptose:LPS heptosyltransferase